MVSGYMKPVEAKKFVMFWSWGRIKVDTNRSVNNITDTLSAMRFGVEISKLYV